MESIREYLLTKSNMGKLLKFPMKPVYDDIVTFLVSMGFTEAKPAFYTELFDAKDKAFMVDRSKSDIDNWIRFIDPTHEGKPQIFFVRATEDGSQKSEDIAYIEYSGRGSVDTEFTTYEEFRKEVHKYFGW